jgi:cobalamin biosynthesis Mg chelatase CobN
LDNITTSQELLTPEGVIRYLRRLHHQSTRALSQLNRALNLNQSNSTESLEIFIPVFEQMNSANIVAINCLNELRNARLAHHHNGHAHSQNQSAQQQQGQQNQAQQGQQSSQSTQASQSQQNQQQGQQQQQQGLGQGQGQGQGQQQQGQQQGQGQGQQRGLGGVDVQNNPLLAMAGNFANMFSQLQPQQQSQGQSQSQSQSQPQAPNPLQMLGGLNIGSLLGSVGGMGGLMSITLREMMSEN